MVLSTSKDNIVSSRMMSFVIVDGLLYFQTVCNSRKYKQLIYKFHVAICKDNVQIEGLCREIGKPSDYSFFVNSLL